MSGFVVAAYGVILGSLAVYALYLRARCRTLEREAHGPPGATGPDTLPGTEDA